MPTQDMKPGDDNPMPEVARKLFERMALQMAPQRVTAAMLAAHVAFETGKSYDAKNIKKALNQAGCQPQIEGTGQRGNEWLYGDILYFLRTFAKGRAKGVNWPDTVKELSGGKNSP